VYKQESFHWCNKHRLHSKKNIDLNGIVKVNRFLGIGNPSLSGCSNAEDSGIYFENSSSILTYGSTSSMEIGSTGYLFLNADIKFGGYFEGSPVSVDFSNANVSGLYARFG
jgi:hypothetical protein